MRNSFKTLRIASIIGLGLATGLSTYAAGAADKAADGMKAKDMASPAYSDRAHMKAYGSDRDALQAQLKPGMNAAAYRKKLADLGYQITAVNDREADYMEFEVVKGANSHEVQIDFDKSTKMATKVDVAMNMWRADSTKAAVRGEKATMVTTADYSDRAYQKQWSNEKDGLEKALGVGKDKAYYPTKLKQLGYSVTATNDREADYVEYEVVKANRTYEVQIDFDGKSNMASKVDVTTNLWNAEATEKAMDARK